MLSKKEDIPLLWKELGNGAEVAHYPSRVLGQQIYLKKVKSLKKTKTPTTIFLFHDLTSYHGRFSNLVSWFQVQHPDITFIMIDFLGHGLSSGTRVHIEKFSTLVDDMAQVFELLDKNDNEKWVALGHGMGAVCLLDLLNRFDDSLKRKIDKVILSNFFLHFPSILLQMQNKVFENFLKLESVMKTSRPVEIYLAESVLTHSHDQGTYLEDPLINRKPTYQTLKMLTTKVKGIFQDAYFLDKPTLVLKSDSSYSVSKGMDSFSKGLKKGILTEKKYSNLKHDLYNESDNSIVFNDIAEWVKS